MNTSINHESLWDDGINIIFQQIEEEGKAIHSHAESSAQAFFSSISSKIPAWIDGYRCYHHIDNMFKLKRQVMDYTEELVSYLQDDIRKETQDWVEHQFVPLVQREMTTLSQAVNSNVNAYQNQLAQLSLPVDINGNAIVKSSTPSTRNRIFSTGACILMGDFGGAVMGGLGGSDAMFKTLGCEFGAGIILGIISMFTPVGLAAMIASVIASTIIGGSWALSSVENKVRKTLKEKSRDAIISTQRKNELMKTINGKIDSFINQIKDNVECDLRQCS